MKKALFATVLLSSGLGFGLAQAQSWTVEGPFRDEFGGCFRVATGQVQCLLKSTYTGAGNTYYGATYFATDSAAYAPDQKRYIATQTTLNGRDISKAEVNISKAAPVTVVYTFDYPKNYDSIALLFLDTGTLKSVAIKPLSAAQATPVTTSTPTPATQAPKAAAPASAPQPVRPDSFDIKLSNCTFNAQGGYSCKGAELIPLH